MSVPTRKRKRTGGERCALATGSGAPLDNYERFLADGRALQAALQEATEQEKSMKKQKYYLVLAEANTPPLAMFAMREWAEAWKITNCATAIIEEFEMLIRLPLPNAEMSHANPKNPAVPGVGAGCENPRR